MITPQQAIWRAIGRQRTAVLVTVGRDGRLQSRPMGCLQSTFEGTLWFMTFKRSPKLLEIDERQEVLVSYAARGKNEFASLSGRARMVEDPQQVRVLWFEGLRTWFPEGPSSPEIALIAVDVESARIWRKPASLLRYALFYIRARLTGRSPTPDQMVEFKEYRLDFHDVPRPRPERDKERRT